VLEWFATLDPPVVAALVSAAVSIVVAAFTALAAPALKYRWDSRLEAQKLDLQYTSEQRKALRDHIARHKGRMLETLEDMTAALCSAVEGEDLTPADMRRAFASAVEGGGEQFKAVFRYLDGMKPHGLRTQRLVAAQLIHAATLNAFAIRPPTTRRVTVAGPRRATRPRGPPGPSAAAEAPPST